MENEKKPKSEIQKKAEATITSRSVFEQAVITLKNQTAAEVDVWDVAKTDLERIRGVVRENTDRHFALLGEPEEPYSGYGPKRPYRPSGLIADARDELDEALTGGKGVATKQKGLDALIKEAETLTEWLDGRAEKVVRDAETAVNKCRVNVMRKAQGIYQTTTVKLCAEADAGMAMVFDAFCEDSRVRKHFAVTVPDWKMPSVNPLHCAGFVATLYPNLADLDMYSTMAKLFTFDRARAKNLHLKNTQDARIKAEAVSETEWERRIKCSVKQKMTALIENHNAYNDKPFTEAETEREKAGFRQEYIETHTKPKVEIFVDANKPKLPKERTYYDIETEVKQRQRELYLAQGLTEKGLKPGSKQENAEPEKEKIDAAIKKPKRPVKKKEFSQKTQIAVKAFVANYVERSGEQPHPDEIRTFAEDFEFKFSRR